MAAPAATAASASVDPFARKRRNHRMGGSSGTQIHLSADLQPDQIGPKGIRHVPRRGGAARLYFHAVAAWLGGSDLCRRDRRDRAARGAAAYRSILQQVLALSDRDAAAARLFVG